MGIRASALTRTNRSGRPAVSRSLLLAFALAALVLLPEAAAAATPAKVLTTPV